MKTRDYEKEKYAHETDHTKPFKYDPGLENGLKVLHKEIPLKVHSYQHDMLTMIKIAKEFDFNLTLDHALGAGDFADEIVESKAAVIYGPIGCCIFPGELCKIDIDCLVTLDQRGVCCAIMTDGPCLFPEYMVVQAGEVVRFGGNHYDVMKMITINPAKIIGCDQRIGSLEPGKDADLVIYQKTPALDTDAQTCYTIIDGKIVYQR
ncbi:hypothetical protein SDC9_180593 [bioreactor metagenome]|uniref:Amidohydrolase-related domain-containing protein n=1 Tax=bioreactor metagenome TaxID=1076179 RepID=A0A645H332_9ZZZZ